MGDSTEARAINYAEQVLAVHDVYNEAKQATASLKHLFAAEAAYAARKRELAEAIADRTSMVTSELRAKYNDLSATAFKPVLDLALQDDPDLKRLRFQMVSTQHEHDKCSGEIKSTEAFVRVLTARMENLNGLLNFYAAVKTTKSTTTKPSS